jgi:transcriptional repressor of cell division inhibition gene dicB
MTMKQVLSHFGTQTKVAEALKISQAAVAQWGDEVPLLRQYQLERITEGELKVGF